MPRSLSRALAVQAACAAFLALPVGAHALQSEALLETTASWDGAPLQTPLRPQIGVFKIRLAPGEALPFHCHPSASAEYLEEGELTVETLGGKRRTFKAGEAMTEVTGTWHKGFNASQEKPVVLIAVYIGEPGAPRAVPLTQDNRALCKE